MKKILVVLIAVIGLCIGGLFFALNPLVEHFRPVINQKISSQVGIPITLGEMSISLFPTLGFNIKEAVVKDGSEARIENLVLAADLKGLLNRNVAVKKLVADSLSLHILRRADGTLTLAGLPLGKKKEVTSSSTSNATGSASSAVSTSNPEEKDASLAFAIKDIELKNADITFVDEGASPKQTIEVTDLAISVSNLSNQNDNGTIAIDGKLLGAQNKNFSLKGKASLKPQASGIPSLDLALDLSDLDTEKLLSLAKAYGVNVEGLTLSQALSAQVSAKSNNEGVLSNSKVDATKTAIQFGEAFKKASGVPLVFSASVRPFLNGAIEVKDIQLQIAELRALSSVSFDPSKDSNVSVSIPPFSLAELGKVLPSVASMPIEGTAGIEAKLVLAKNSNSPFPAVDAKIDLKNLSLKTSTEAKEGISNTSGLVTVSIPKGSPYGTVSADIPSLNYGAYTFTTVKVLSEFSKSAYILKPSSLEMFGGKLLLEGAYQLAPANTIAITLKGQGMDLAQVSKVTLQGSAISFTGAVSSLLGKLQGNSSALTQTIAGPVGMSVIKGSIEGINIVGSILKKIDIIPGLGSSLVLLVPEQFKPLIEASNTAFDTLDGSVSLGSGNAKVEKLSLKHPAYIIEGLGDVNIAGSGDMDLEVKLKLTQAMVQGMILKEPKVKLLLDKDGNLVIPALIKRSQGKTLVLPDLKVLLENAAKGTAKEAATKALDKVAPGLGGALDSLFK